MYVCMYVCMYVSTRSKRIPSVHPTKCSLAGGRGGPGPTIDNDEIEIDNGIDNDS